MMTPFYPHQVKLERMTGDDSWEGATYGPQEDWPAWVDRRSSNRAAGADAVAVLQTDRARVPFNESGYAPGIGDKIGGTIIEAYDDVLDSQGRRVERVVYLEPGAGRG